MMTMKRKRERKKWGRGRRDDDGEKKYHERIARQMIHILRG